MKNFFPLLMLCVASFNVKAQFVYKIKADSVLITNDSCSAELNLENSTKTVNGFLYNKGNGRTEFRRGLVQYNDTLWILGDDTLNMGSGGLFWKLGGNASTNPVANFLGTTDAQRLVFRTKNQEWATIDTLGRVGIGRSNPSEKVDIYNGVTKISGTYGYTHSWGPLVVIDSSSTNPFKEYNLAFLQTPNLPDTSRVNFQIGQSNSTNNMAHIGFSKFTNGSSSNYIQFAIWGTGNLLKLHANKNVEIGKGGSGTLVGDDGYRLNVLKSETGITAEGRVINASTQGATYNTTSSALSSYGGYFNSNGTRASGSNDLTNIGLFATASGGQANYALKTDGSVNMVNLPSITDTNSYKPLGINSTGDIAKVTGWPPAPNYTVQTLTDGTTITWNAANGINAVVTLGGTGRTLSITNPVAGMTYTIRIIQDGSGSRTITTWPTNSKWPSGTTPTLSTVANRYDIVVLYYDGTNYYGTYQQNFQ